MCRAILGHGAYTGVPRDSLMAQTLFAVDELCGFLVACALVRPSKSFVDLEVSSVKKKLKDKGFARGVNRDEVNQGAAELGVPLDERSEEHTSELQSQSNLVCRLLLEKKHTYDKPDMAQLGLPAARRYAQLAPAAPHALHMPAHIFARLGLWQDDIDSNVRSIAATQKEAAEHMGGEGHQFHAMDFLVYAYLQNWREQDAQKIIDEVRAMAPMHDMYGMGFDPRMFALSSFPASYELELHHWNEAAQLTPVSGAVDYDQSVTYTARAIGAARSGN